MRSRCTFRTGGAAVAFAAAVLAPPAAAGSGPHAAEVVSYDPGANPAPGFTDPATALGPPERFSGEDIFPSVVSPFSPPFLASEIVSIGAGGHLVLRFARPVTDDPANPFGIDLLVFGNTGFIDAAFPAGVVGGVFGDDGGVIELSADCRTWVEVAGIEADGLMPALGYLDAGPYDPVPGEVESNFTRPVDPRLRRADLLGLAHERLVELYAGSGGGAGIDLAAAGLSEVSCVRLSNPGRPPGTTAIKIDALSDVAPEPDPADLDGDGSVGIADLLLLLSAWGRCPVPPRPCPADLDGDGEVGVTDLIALLGGWSP